MKRVRPEFGTVTSSVPPRKEDSSVVSLRRVIESMPSK
jgi:hypothetical protein